MRRLWTALLLGCAALATARAAYLEQDAWAPAPPPPHGWENPLRRFIGRLRVAEPVRWKGLTFFPVVADRVTDSTGYLCLDEALRCGVLLLRDSGHIGTALAENRGERPILLLAGEVLRGGRQNRALRHDALLPAHSGPFELPVCCVERDRWQGGAEFGACAGLAPGTLRDAIATDNSQQEVWAHVEALLDRAGAGNTGDLTALWDVPGLNDRLAKCRRHLEGCWPRRSVGMVVARGLRILGADLFCNPQVFRKHMPRLMDSYAVEECLREPDCRVLPPPPDRRVAERFLRGLARARCRWRPAPAAGRLLEAQGPGVEGQALVWHGEVLHVHAQQGPTVLPVERTGGP